MNKFIVKYMQPSGISIGIFQLLLPFFIYLGVVSASSWHWWAASIFFYAIVYNMIGHNIGLHRYITHNHFTVAKPIEWLFVWAGSMIMVGSPVSYAVTHTVHHKYPDTELDPHGPVRGLKSVWMYFQKTVDLTETPIFSKRVITLMRKYNWLQMYYIPFVLANAGILWLIDYRVFLFFWAIPAGIACWGIGVIVLVHHWGFAPGNSKINTWTLIIEGLHKNHHDYPMAPNSAIHRGEIDWTYKFSKIFLPVFNWKGQPNRND